MASNDNVIKGGLLNIQLVSNKTIQIREMIDELRLDFFILTETWLRNGIGDESKINEMTPLTHVFHHKPRENKTGGGVGIFLSKQFSNVSVINRSTYETFEHLEIKFNYNNKVITLVALYRPPSTNAIRFNEEFGNYLDLFNEELMKTCICGDFNLWM